MGVCVGIDLGTCFSSIAYCDMDTKELALIPNEEGELKTPSVMMVHGDGTILYGQEALDKKMAGDGEVIPTFRECLMDTAYTCKVGAVTYDGVSLIALFLNHLLEQARRYLKREIGEAIITVPSYYTNQERRSLKEALKQTGLYVSGLINDTTAAALAYSYRNPEAEKNVLVYKLGAGTFEAAVVKMSKGQVYVLGSTYNKDLSLTEWEDIILGDLQDRFYQEFHLDFTEDRMESIKLRSVAEQFIIRLSEVSSAQAVISYKGSTGKYRITRERFEQMSKTVMELTIRMVEHLLQDVGISNKQLDGFLLSGRGTKMPMVKKGLEKCIACPCLHGVSADYDVCYGAAIKAGFLKRSPLPDKAVETVHEVVANSLGMISVSLDGAWYVNSILIHKNSKIPANNTRTFRLPVTNKGTNMAVYLLQGEAATPKDCQVVGKYVIENIAYVEGGIAYVEVTYTYDGDAMIHVSARQRETGEELTIHQDYIPEDMEWVTGKPKMPEECARTKEGGLIYICVDLSGSMAGVPFMEAKRAAKELVEQLDLTSQKVGIVGFADHSQLVLNPTGNSKNIFHILQRMHISGKLFGYGNGTSPFAMIYERHCAENQPLQEEVAMVVLTDGAWSDKERAMKVAERLKEKGVAIYTMAFGHAEMDFLTKLASSSEFSSFTQKKRDKGRLLTIAQIVSEDESE